jgi:hypothetical protein
MDKLGRTLHEFPSRQYKYTTTRLESIGEAMAAPPDLEAGAVYRFVLGRDSHPQRLSKQQIEDAVADPFAHFVLLQSASPILTLRALLAHLDRFNADPAGLPSQRSFVVADGGQVPWTPQTDELNRQFRVTITRAATDTGLTGLFVSTSTLFDSEETFLQVIGWDPRAGAYQFYERRSGAWIWAGSSWDSLEPGSRGQGPFDSHVNGALNMKELKQPWVNWHSQAAAILDDVLAPTDPLRAELLWTDRSPAEVFETTVIRPGIQRWTDARFVKCTVDGHLIRLPEFFRHVLETTTVNLTSSTREHSVLNAGGGVDLPLTFFLNSSSLFDDLGIDADFNLPSVPAAVYQECLQRFEVALIDQSEKFRFPGDTHFLFVVPEVAFEDILVLRKLLSLGILSPKLAAAIAMVDFCNPVFSTRRAALLKHVPESAAINGPDAFAASFVAAVKAADPGHEFLQNWSLPDDQWKETFAQRIITFMDSVRRRTADFAGFEAIFRLAESRRREFRKRPLAEFRLTTPVSNIPEDAPLLEFAPDGAVRNK